jgi:hypothetical protein
VSQLERLAILTDVVYAVTLVLVISWPPLPELPLLVSSPGISRGLPLFLLPQF